MTFDECCTLAEVAVSKGIMQLMRSKNLTYITSIIMNLPREFTEAIPTAAINKTTLKINPFFFMELDEDERRFVLVHEAWHPGLMDLVRGAGKDHQQWNKACDHYNNLMIEEEGNNLLKVPDWVLKKPKYKGWEKEAIYNDLMKTNDQQQSKMGDDLVAGGEGDEELSPEQIKEISEELSKIVQQAAMTTKMAGAPVPDEINEYLDKLYNPRLPWSRILARYMSDYCSDDYSYQRVNKPMFPTGILLPTLYSEGMGTVAIANDSSGSVSDEDFQLYLGAILDIKNKLNPTRMDVVNFTTRITEQWSVEQDEDIKKIQFRSSGGTDLHPVFQHFLQPKNRPEVLIVFSDLECTPITKKPPFDVIWIVVNNPSAQVHFGRKIHIETQ